MDVSGELANASMLQFLKEKHGDQQGHTIFEDWCWGYDPESPTTIEQPYTLPRAESVKAQRYLHNEVLHAALITASKAEKRLAEEKHAGRFLRDWISYGHPASYALVVSKSRSSTGSPLLMGGPQFEYQLPSALHEVGLHGAGIDAVGSTLAGYPFVMFGHNGHAAFSSTAGIDNI